MILRFELLCYIKNLKTDLYVLRSCDFFRAAVKYPNPNVAFLVVISNFNLENLIISIFFTI